MTNEERIKILEMVAAGKLTVEQASQLMDKLGTKSTTDAAKRPDQGQRSGALQEAGLADLTVRQVISLYNNGVDADDVRALREDGVAGPTVERLLSLKKYGV